MNWQKVEHPKTSMSTKLLLRRLAFHDALTSLQMTALLVMSFILTISSIVSREQVWHFATSLTSIALVLCATALLFFSGLYVMQRVMRQRINLETRMLLAENKTRLAQITTALKTQQLQDGRSANRSKDSPTDATH